MVSYANLLNFNLESFQSDDCIPSAWKLTQQNAPTVECRRPCVALDAREHQIITLVMPWQLSIVVATVKQMTGPTINLIATS
jgi:hypothetical protein